MGNLGAVAYLNQKNLPPAEKQFAKLHAAGFDYVSAPCTGNEPVEAWVRQAQSAGLTFLALNTPATPRLDQLWLPGIPGDALVAELCNRIERAGKAGIPYFVLFPTGEKHSVPASQAGLTRLRRLAAFARECSVRLCFENRRAEEHLHLALAVCGEEHGLCFSSAANAALTPESNPVTAYAHALRLVYLADCDLNHPNERETHLLPFDGSIPWEKTAATLHRIGYTGPLLLDVPYPDKADGYDSFLARAYDRMRRIAAAVRDGTPLLRYREETGNFKEL